MPKKNVLHLVEYLYLGGIERLLEQLAFKMDEKANVHFFSYETEKLDGIEKQIKDKGFPVFIYKKSNGRDCNLLAELIRVVKSEKIEVIHTHDFGPIEYAVLLKIRFPKIRLIHTHHTIFEFIKNRKYTFFFQFASFFYHRISVVSLFVKETILQHCPFMKRSILRIIPNGVDVDHFKKSDERSLMLTNRLNLVSVSRISEEKNLNYLFNTCRHLKNIGIPFVFHHAGTSLDPGRIEDIKHYLKMHHLEDNVVLHGFSSDVLSILDLGNIYLSASLTEGHPVSVLEAMSCEKNCFCSDIAAHRELGQDSIKLFDLNDELSLTNLLVSHFENLPDAESSEIGKAARNKIVESFSIEKMVNNYVNKYK